MKSWPLIREVLLCVCGLVGVAYEAIVQKAERPSLLLTYMGMMGLSAIVPMVRLRGNGGGTTT